MDFSMLEEGDRVMVAVSGGKDSLSLLHLMRDRQKISPVRFDILAVHIDGGPPGLDQERLKKHFEKEGFDHRIEKTDFLDGKNWEDIDCFWCSWNRRKALFRLMDAERCNKIALGHHMDDIVETILMNLFYRAEIGAMKPRQELFDGKVTIIRPLCYVRERDLMRLARNLGLEGMTGDPCPHEGNTRRMAIKRLVARLEKDNKDVVKNIFGALRNIKTDYLLGLPPA